MGDVQADLPAMQRFAQGSVGREDEFNQLRLRMDDVRVPREAFGYIPGIGSRVYEAYDEFVDGCAAAIWAAGDVMAAIGEAVQDTAVAYRESDDRGAAALGQIEFGMAGLNVLDPR
jgi:hypothetical protein